MKEKNQKQHNLVLSCLSDVTQHNKTLYEMFQISSIEFMREREWEWEWQW